MKLRYLLLWELLRRNIEHHLIQNNANLVLEEFGLPKRFINPEIGWLKEAIEIHGEDEGYPKFPAHLLINTHPIRCSTNLREF